MIDQAVIGWHDHAINDSCRILVNNDNWNDTYRLPVRAVVDGKAAFTYTDSSGTVTVDRYTGNLNIKVVVDGATRYTRRINVSIRTNSKGWGYRSMKGGGVVFKGKQATSSLGINWPYIYKFI